MEKHFDSHPGNRKRLMKALDDYSLTLQHAIRQDLRAYLEQRAKDEADVLPPLSALEMFDYCMDADPDFLNTCFPFCAVMLTKENIGYLHNHILQQFRLTLVPEQTTE